MTDPSYPTEPQRVETPRRPGRSKRVLAGAALVAAGVVAGGGATYAIASQVSPTTPGGTSTVQPGGPGGGPRGGLGVRPNGSNPGTLPDGSAPTTAPDGTAPGGTASGGTTDPSAAPSTQTS